MTGKLVAGAATAPRGGRFAATAAARVVGRRVRI
jgi:hypothetical protein